MNILSFDIEEWYLEKLKGGNRAEYYSDCNDLLSRLLDKLDERDVKATFFCLGKMAEEFPHVVSEITRRGHDIGCHSHEHGWLTKMTPEEMYQDTKLAKDALEQIAGKEIISYRAPAFTITKENKWAIQVLSELGFQIDSSVFPINHEIGGFPEFPEKKPCIIKYGGHSIKEFPLISMTLFGKSFAYSGGGYFRLIPYPIINRELRKTDYFIGYFHLSDLLSSKIPMMNKEDYEIYFKQTGTLLNRYMRYLKCNIGVSGAYNKLVKLILNNDFCSIKEACNHIDWSLSKSINL